jgi:hypothetical protein
MLEIEFLTGLEPCENDWFAFASKPVQQFKIVEQHFRIIFWKDDQFELVWKRVKDAGLSKQVLHQLSPEGNIAFNGILGFLEIHFCHRRSDEIQQFARVRAHEEILSTQGSLYSDRHRLPCTTHQLLHV